jgi:hypothetical protein
MKFKYTVGTLLILGNKNKNPYLIEQRFMCLVKEHRLNGDYLLVKVSDKSEMVLDRHYVENEINNIVENEKNYIYIGNSKLARLFYL